MRRLVVVALLLSAQAWGQTVPQTGPQSPSAPQVPPPPVAAPVETWVPRGNVDLTGLDKITTRTTALSAKVGQAVTFGTLSVTVRSCIVRAPDQPADQAAFLDVTDSREPGFGFHGWMLLSSPGVSVIEHPVYDVRLAGCRP